MANLSIREQLIIESTLITSNNNTIIGLSSDDFINLINQNTKNSDILHAKFMDGAATDGDRLRRLMNIESKTIVHNILDCILKKLESPEIYNTLTYIEVKRISKCRDILDKLNCNNIRKEVNSFFSLATILSLLSIFLIGIYLIQIYVDAGLHFIPVEDLQKNSTEMKMAYALYGFTSVMSNIGIISILSVLFIGWYTDIITNPNDIGLIKWSSIHLYINQKWFIKIITALEKIKPESKKRLTRIGNFKIQHYKLVIFICIVIIGFALSIKYDLNCIIFVIILIVAAIIGYGINFIFGICLAAMYILIKTIVWFCASFKNFTFTLWALTFIPFAAFVIGIFSLWYAYNYKNFAVQNNNYEYCRVLFDNEPTNSVVSINVEQQKTYLWTPEGSKYKINESDGFVHKFESKDFLIIKHNCAEYCKNKKCANQ